MNNQPPIQERAGDRWSPSWRNWFQQVFACLSWNKSFSANAALDFPSVPAQSEMALTVSVIGARPSDFATVCPSAHTAGIVYAAVVTAKDTVTVYAQNFTAGAIDPAPASFRVIVFQS